MTHLSNALKRGLRQLIKFSLRITNEPESGSWCACHCDWRLEGLYFSRILEELPPSCVSLELDSGGFDDQYVARDMRSADLILADHICNALRKVVPRLEHLRLRLSSLCPHFFLRGSERRIKGRTYMRSSPCRLWAAEADRYEPQMRRLWAPFGPDCDRGMYFYHDPLFGTWDEWMQKSERESWKLKHKVETSTPLSAGTEQDPLPLRTCIINTCLFPHDLCSALHGQWGEASAAILAQSLQQAKDIWKILPNLEQCKIISSCFEASDEELNHYYLPLSNANEISPSHPADILFGYNEISEFTVHDVRQNTTTTIPFKRINLSSWNQTKTLTHLRNQRTYEYKPPSSNGQSYLTSLAAIEDHIESAWSIAAITQQGPHRLPPASAPSSSPPASFAASTRTPQLFLESHLPDSVLPLPTSHFPHDAPETFFGLLDRASIWEERVLHGDRSQYKSWTEMQEMQPLVTRFGQLKRWHGPHDEDVLLGEDDKDGMGKEQEEAFGNEHHHEGDIDDLFGSESGD